MIAIQSTDGEYYLSVRMKDSGERKMYHNLFLVKHWTKNIGILHTKFIKFPQEFIGKKVRIKIEVAENVE